MDKQCLIKVLLDFRGIDGNSAEALLEGILTRHGCVTNVVQKLENRTNNLHHAFPNRRGLLSSD
jgi:hypothetical protein